ncbi:flagellar hook-associated protein FlgK [Tropicimonas sp. S265A]|uniref:flagellar hook-associated protein FlgK n=1 Tax=Tropicimonas sp. S265A TaxID=3415134 RepID=UPI003C79C5C6
MSITASLSNALSGLSANSRAAQIVSSNVSNSTTEGYAVRSLNTSAASLAGVGAGVRVDGVVRNVNEVVLADRREADADVAFDANIANYFARIESEIGLPGDSGSLDEVLVKFEAALVDAASRPDQTVRLDAAVQAAGDVVAKLSQVSKSIQSERQDADREISRQVEQLNSVLQQVEDLNATISVQRVAGNDALALMDQRQVLIDQISGIVPVSVMPRDNGQVAIISSGGAVLLDGKAATFEFTPVNTITPDMTVGSNALSMVLLNGQPVDLSRATNMLQGGSLDALFSIRDELSIGTQQSIDTLAADLISRFEDPVVDASLSLGDPGLFTDDGAVLNPADLTGLSQRISLNASVDPAQGGETWRIRDGMGASVQGPAGEAAQILAFVDVLAERRPPVSATPGAASQTFFAVSSQVLSDVGLAGQRAEEQMAFSSAKWEALRLVELEGGVDTDAELQKLLQIEQAYAANAKVIETIGDLLDTLTRI